MAGFVPNTAFPERHPESAKKRQFSLALLINGKPFFGGK